MINHFSLFKLITDTNIYKIRVILLKVLIYEEKFKKNEENKGNLRLFSYTKIVENAA